jgi:hypothetical protein
MKKTILFAILFTLFISCSEDDENTILFNDNMCFDELSNGFLNYTKNGSYFGLIPSGDVGSDTINYYNQSTKETFYVRKKDGKLVYSALFPLVFQCSNCIPDTEFTLDLCSGKSFVAEHDSIIEKINLIYNGEVVEGEFLYDIEMAFNFIGTSEETLFLDYNKDPGQLFRVNKYRVELVIEEVLLKPEDIVFQNGQRTRNKMTMTYFLDFAPGLGIILIEENGNVMKLINYGPPTG